MKTSVPQEETAVMDGDADCDGRNRKIIEKSYRTDNNGVYCVRVDGEHYSNDDNFKRWSHPVKSRFEEKRREQKKKKK